MMTSTGSNQELIENSFDIFTTKFKLDIFSFLYSWPVNPRNDTLQIGEGHKQREAMLYLFSL